MSDNQSFDIHGNVSLLIVGGKHRGIFQGLAYPYSFFSSEDVNNPDIVVRLGDFSPNNANSILVDHKYHIRRGYFFCCDQTSGAKWKLEVEGFGSTPMKIRFHCKVGIGILRLIPEYVVHNVLIRPLVEYLMHTKGFSVIHGAAVSDTDDRSALVFFGRGGAHKTRIVMELLRTGRFHFLGEDRVFLKDRIVYPYPYLYDVFDFRINHLAGEEYPNLMSRVRFLQHLRGKCKGPHLLWQVSDATKLRYLYEVRRSNEGNVRFTPLSKEVAASKIRASNELELFGDDLKRIGVRAVHFHEYLTAYSFVNPDAPISHYIDHMEHRILSNLGNCRTVSLRLPMHFGMSTFKSVLASPYFSNILK